MQRHSRLMKTELLKAAEYTDESVEDATEETSRINIGHAILLVVHVNYENHLQNML